MTTPLMPCLAMKDSLSSSASYALGLDSNVSPDGRQPSSSGWNTLMYSGARRRLTVSSATYRMIKELMMAVLRSKAECHRSTAFGDG